MKTQVKNQKKIILERTTVRTVVTIIMIIPKFRMEEEDGALPQTYGQSKDIFMNTINIYIYYFKLVQIFT